MKTRVTKLFDIDLPIIGGGMVWMSTAALAAAVSNAGGIGLIAAGSNTPDSLALEIDRIRELTDKPFGINVPLLYPFVGDMMDVIIDKGVKVVFTSAGSPKKFTPMLKKAGVTVVHVVPSALLAGKCEAAGVDAVVAEGSEGGGHLAFDEVSTFVLVPMVKKTVSIPVIAAGGIGVGAQIAAAFALGAEGVQIGTRFIATKECEGHINFKNAIINAGETGTTVTGKNISPIRGIKNKLTDAILEMERRGKTKEEILEFIGVGRARSASQDGDVDWGTVQCGQVAGLIDDLPTVKNLVDKMMSEAKETVELLEKSFLP